MTDGIAIWDTFKGIRAHTPDCTITTCPVPGWERYYVHQSPLSVEAVDDLIDDGCARGDTTKEVMASIDKILEGLLADD